MSEFIKVPYFNIKNDNINDNQRIKEPMIKNNIIRGIRTIKSNNITERKIVRTANRNIRFSTAY